VETDGARVGDPGDEHAPEDLRALEAGWKAI